jgi:hypothetical protein
MRTIPARRSAEKGTMYTGQRGLAVRHPLHPVCGLRTAGAPVALLDAGRPVFLDQAVIYRPVKVSGTNSYPSMRSDGRHPGHDNPITSTAASRTRSLSPGKTSADRLLDLRV